MKFWYIATPYSKYPAGLEAAFQLAVRVRGRLVCAGVPCFSPIIHSHPVAMSCDLDPLDHVIWLASEEPILQAAHGLIMVTAESWQLSYGMDFERVMFDQAKKPVVWMEPDGDLPKELLT